jgi:hypothetical protein
MVGDAAVIKSSALDILGQWIDYARDLGKHEHVKAFFRARMALEATAPQILETADIIKAESAAFIEANCKPSPARAIVLEALK